MVDDDILVSDEDVENTFEFNMTKRESRTSGISPVFKPSSTSPKKFYKENPQFIVKYKSKSGKDMANKRMKSRKGTNKTSSRVIEDLDRYDVQIVEIDTIDELQAFEEDEDVEFVEEGKFLSKMTWLYIVSLCCVDAHV